MEIYYSWAPSPLAFNRAAPLLPLPVCQFWDITQTVSWQQGSHGDQAFWIINLQEVTLRLDWVIMGCLFSWGCWLAAYQDSEEHASRALYAQPLGVWKHTHTMCMTPRPLSIILNKPAGLFIVSLSLSPTQSHGYKIISLGEVRKVTGVLILRFDIIESLEAWNSCR